MNFDRLAIGDLLRLYIVRGMEGESKISEHWGDIVASRFKVRFLQWLGSMAGMGGILFGAVLLGTPLAMALGQEGILDTLFVGVVVAIAAILTVFGFMLIFRHSRSTMVIAILSAGVVSIVVLVVVFATIALAEDMDWWRAILALVGTCIFTPSLAYTFNQLSDLVDPMGWISGFERMMRPYLLNLLETETKKVEVRPVFPWRHGDREKRLTSREKDEEDGIVSVPDYRDLELADFLGEALVRGFGRDSAWIGKGVQKYVLPSTGRTVRRGVYDELIRMAIEKGYVRPGGGIT